MRPRCSDFELPHAGAREVCAARPIFERVSQVGHASAPIPVEPIARFALSHLRQNAGVASTSTLKISSRPRSIATVQTQVWYGVSAW
jgi:hypothetical protein